MDNKCSFNLFHFLTQLTHCYTDTIRDILTYGRMNTRLFTIVMRGKLTVRQMGIAMLPKGGRIFSYVLKQNICFS